MKSFFANTMVGVVSGIIVAAVSFYYISGKPSAPDLPLEYSSVPFNHDFNSLIYGEFRDVFERLEVLNKGEGETKEQIRRDLEVKDAILDARINGVFSGFGLIELIVVENTDNTSAVEILIEGRGTKATLVDSKDVGKKNFSGNFDLKLKVLPGEMLKIINVDEYSNYSPKYKNEGSDSLLVSVGGIYLVPLNRVTILDDLFGKWMNLYPFGFFLLIVLGFILVLISFSEIALRINPVWRRAFLASQTDENSLAIYDSILLEIEQKDSEKRNRISKESSKLMDIDKS